MTEISQSPDADIVFVRSGRVVISKSGQDLLIYSAIGNDEDWHENSNDDSARKDVNVGYKDGGDIVGVVELATDLLVFKTNGLIYTVQNEPSDWNIMLLGSKSDFISRHACTNLGKDVVFMSTTGLKSYATSMSYSNFEPKDIGEKCNPYIKRRLDSPVISDLRRTKQLIVSGDSRNTVYVYHYGLKAFTKWTFKHNITSICENRYHTLVSMNESDAVGKIYELSWNNKTDDGQVIHQEILSGEIRDTHDMNVYRTYIDVLSDVSGTADISVNKITMHHTWEPSDETKEFKTQIRSNKLQFKFETDTNLIFKFVSFDIVMERESMVSQGSSTSSRRRSGFGAKKRSSHDDFLKNINSSGGSPYGS